MGKTLSRTESREVAFRIIYADNFANSNETRDGTRDGVFDLALDNKIATEPERKFIDKILETYKKNEQQINSQIKGERIKTIDLAILRTAFTELLINEVPKSVVINEAVNLAKKYSDGESPAFVNGVLANE